MKKWIVLTLVLAFTVSLLGVTATAETAQRPRFSIVANYPLVNPEAPWIQAINDRFGVDIEWISLGDQVSRPEGVTQLNLMMSDPGTMPDCIVYRPDTCKEYTEWEEAGLIVDLTPYLKEYGQELFQYYQKMYNLNPLFGCFNKDGKLYSIPSDVTEPGNNVLLVRKAYREALGIDKIETLDDYVDFIRRCTKEDPDGNGIADTYGVTGIKNDLLHVYPFFTAYGVDPKRYMIQEDGTIKWGSVMPECRKSLELLRDLYAEGCIDPNLVVGSKNQFQAYAENKAGSTYFTIWCLSSRCAPLKPLFEADPTLEMEWLQPVSGPDGFAADKPEDSVNSLRFAVTTNCKYPAEAVRFVCEAIEYENYQWRNFGEEGVDYVLNEDGSAKLLATGEERDMKGIGIPGLFFTRKDEANIEYGAYALSCLKNITETSKPLRDRIFFPSAEADASQYNKYYSDLEAMRDYAFWSIITGQEDISYFDTFVNEYYERGGKQVEEEMTALYQRSAQDRATFDAFVESNFGSFLK